MIFTFVSSSSRIIIVIMLFVTLVNYFAANIFTFTALISLIAVLRYYIYVLKPLAKFPSCRMEYRILYWTLLKRPLNVEIFKNFIELSKKHKDQGMFMVWLYKPILLVYDEEIVKFIVQDPSTINRSSHYKCMEFVLGKGLLTSDGDLWKKQRKNISPAFHVKALKTYVSVMNSNAKALVEKLSAKENEPIDNITHILSECTLRLLYESSLGVRKGEAKKEEETVKRIKVIAEFFIQRILSPWLHFDFALQIFPSARQAVRFDAKNKRTFVQILKEIRESVRAQSTVEVGKEEFDVLDTKPKSFGEIIIEDRLKQPSFSMQDVADDISILIAAGFETSAHALMWSLFFLGLHEDMQERLYEEISTITNEKVEYSDVQDLVYLDCVIKETLRIQSNIPIFARRLNKDVKIGNHFFPKDIEIAVFSYALHRNPDIYPDPEKFNPDRFLDKDSKITPWNYIPFAEGNRSCIGKNFALLTIKIVLVHVLKKFKIVSLSREEDLQLKWAIFLACKKDPCMKFVPRLKEPVLNPS